MLSVKPFSAGKLTGTIYDASETGDTLPMHVHGASDNHVTIVQLGAVYAHGNEWAAVIAAGTTMDWAANDPHELIAMEPDTRYINIVK